MKNHPNNLLSIDQFAAIIGLNPWVVAQVGAGLPTGMATTCDCCLYETIWSKEKTRDGFSRAEMARAIHEAEQMFVQWTGYYPAPKTIVAEPHKFPLPVGRYEPIPPLTLRYGYLHSLGTPVSTLLETIAVTRLATTDDAAFFDSFTATLTVPSGTSADQLRVYFTATDRDNLRLEEWEIRPLDIAISGTTATITGPAYLIAKPRLMRNLPPESVDVTNTDHFVTQVMVYRQTVDTCKQGVLTWLGDCGGSTPCPETTKDACFNILEPRQSQISATSYLVSCSSGQLLDERNLPQRLTVTYTAGYPLQANGLMDQWHAELIAWLAAALMPCEGCTCGCIKTMLKEYRDPPTQKQDDSYRLLMPIELLAKIGIPRLGAVMAYQRAQEIKQRDDNNVVLM